MIKKKVEQRDVSHIKRLMPVSGAILQRLEVLNNRFKSRHSKGSFTDALKSPDLIGQAMVLVPLFIATSVPETGLAFINYVVDGVKKGNW